MKTFSIIDPKNHITLKAKPSIQNDGNFLVIFDLFYLDDKNKVKKGEGVEFFLDESDIDYISYLYHHGKIPAEGYSIIRGRNGVARGFKITHSHTTLAAGHISIKIAKGKGNTMPSGLTSLKQVEQTIIINITFEQTIKLIKFLERAVLIFNLKSEMNEK